MYPSIWLLLFNLLPKLAPIKPLFQKPCDHASWRAFKIILCKAHKVLGCKDGGAVSSSPRDDLSLKLELRRPEFLKVR